MHILPQVNIHPGVGRFMSVIRTFPRKLL
jgi:hypothetical protein